MTRRAKQLKCDFWEKVYVIRNQAFFLTKKKVVINDLHELLFNTVNNKKKRGVIFNFKGGKREIIRFFTVDHKNLT